MAGLLMNTMFLLFFSSLPQLNDGFSDLARVASRAFLF